MKKTTLSVIIPVYYTAGKDRQIKALLRSLYEGTNQDYISEIVIVDNGAFFPAGLVKEIGTAPKIKIVQELRLGLSFARNKGVETSSGDTKAFLDDDCVVCKGWAGAILSGYENQSILCVGGPVEIQDDTPRPRWLSDFFLRFKAPPAFPEKSSILKPPFYLTGANMSFRKECLEKYGLFATDLGRKRNRLLSGEDTEYMLRIPNEAIWFAKEARVTTVGQLNIKRIFFIKRFFWQGITDALMVKKHGKQKIYDIGEVSFSLDFPRRIIRSIAQGNYFQCFCMATRFVAFNFAYLVLKFK